MYAGLLFFGLLYTPVDIVLSMALQYVSRRHEYEADRWSVETYGRPRRALRQLKEAFPGQPVESGAAPLSTYS